MKYWLMILIACMLLNPSAAIAAETDTYEQMIQDYRAALRTNNEDTIARAWKTINDDPQAKAYIENNYPLVASSLRWTELSIKATMDLAQYQANYPSKPVTFDNNGQPVPETTRMTNESEVARFPNENEPPNELVVYRDLQAPFRDNGSRALEYPVQNEPSNQDIIRNRVQRLEQTGQ